MVNDFDKIPDEFIEYIEFRNEFYFVRKKSNNSISTFGKFNSVKEACAATSILLENNWKPSEVSKNSLVTYEGEFWIFEVKDDKLVFDKTFSDFELAVEYVEINARCNDYHNDIFRNSSKKNGRKGRFEFPKQDEKSTSDKYIFEDESGNFIVKKSKRKNSRCLGKFDTFEVAGAARKLLQDSKWNLKDGKEILFLNDLYWVFEIEDNFLTFQGKFESYEDALDFIDSPKAQNDEFENPFIKSIEDYFDSRIFDKKSSESELDVGYMEINAKNNDYNNDIFRKSSKKKGYKSRFEFSMQDEKSTDDKYIFEVESGKFIVKKSKKENSGYFGKFDSFDAAAAARKLLIDSKWNLKDGNEVLFFKDMYWVFEIDYNFLTFKGKSESYEVALDIINHPNSQNVEFEDSFIKSIENNSDSVMTIRKSKKPKRSNYRSKSKSKKPKSTSNNYKRNNDKNLTFKMIVKDGLKIKSHVDITKVWNPKIQTFKSKNKHIRVFVESCGDNVEDLFSILDFNFISDKHIQCIVDGVEINWGDRNNVKIQDFPEFQLIVNILEINGWNLSKINNASSIYFYDDAYYKIHVVDNKIIFGKFASYGAAENTLVIHGGRPVLPIDCNMLGIDKVRDSYEFVKFKNGEVFKTQNLKSLEMIKAIRDILIHEDWDFNIFDKYDLFYLNGFYWELSCTDNIIHFRDKYELIKRL